MPTNVSYEGILETLLGLGAGFLLVTALISLAICILIIVSGFKIFKKMGMPGWWCIIPYFGSYMETRAVYGIGWWFLIPSLPALLSLLGVGGVLLTILNIVSFVYTLKFDMDFARVMGKQWWFGLILLFLPYIAMPMLAFGSAQYKGPRLGGPLAM